MQIRMSFAKTCLAVEGENEDIRRKVAVAVTTRNDVTVQPLDATIIFIVIKDEIFLLLA